MPSRTGKYRFVRAGTVLAGHPATGVVLVLCWRARPDPSLPHLTSRLAGRPAWPSRAGRRTPAIASLGGAEQPQGRGAGPGADGSHHRDLDVVAAERGGDGLDGPIPCCPNGVFNYGGRRASAQGTPLKDEKVAAS